MGVDRSPPPTSVLADFGLRSPVELLLGGQGTSWRGDGVVLKPTGDLAETAWRAEVLARLPESSRFRVAPPVRAASGGWSSGGWEAWTEVAGSPDPQRVNAVLSVSEAFHRAVAQLAPPYPTFVCTRDDPWAYADRIAWGDGRRPAAPAVEGPWSGLYERLLRLRRPVVLPVEPIHGDLLGNVLFAEGVPPAVIDWPVYLRPPLWASAIIVVDAIVWGGSGESLANRHADRPGWWQLVVRAVLFRVLANTGLGLQDRSVHEAPQSYEPIVALLERQRETR
jgi:uncharacterized protein (TIGR02569 family)